MSRPDSLDDEGLRDLLEKVEDALETVTTHVMILERSPSDRVAGQRLTVMVRALKGYCRISYLMGLVEFLEAIETFLAWLESARPAFSFALGEALLLSLDQVKLRIEDLRRNDWTDIAGLWAIRALFEQIMVRPVEELAQHCTDIVKLAGGDTAAHIPLLVPEQAPQPSLALPGPGLDMAELGSDLGFFGSIGAMVDSRCIYWNQRTQTQLDLALGINRLLDKPVDTGQLTAAICVHDLGMVFLAPELLNKPKRFDATDERQLWDHVHWSYQWLRRMPGWEEAAIMVLQHHERPDGSGYPAGDPAPAIHDGAQIIAIADTFFSITHERADRVCRKSLLRAVAEINACRERQFKGALVDAFNERMRQLYARQPADAS